MSGMEMGLLATTLVMAALAMWHGRRANGAVGVSEYLGNQLTILRNRLNKARFQLECERDWSSMVQADLKVTREQNDQLHGEVGTRGDLLGAANRELEDRLAELDDARAERDELLVQVIHDNEFLETTFDTTEEADKFLASRRRSMEQVNRDYRAVLGAPEMDDGYPADSDVGRETLIDFFQRNKDEINPLLNDGAQPLSAEERERRSEGKP